MAAPSRISKTFTDEAVTATVAELDGAGEGADAGAVAANAAADRANAAADRIEAAEAAGETYVEQAEDAYEAAERSAQSVAATDDDLALVTRQRDALGRLLDATRGHGADVVVRQGDALPTVTAGQTLAIAQGSDREGAVVGIGAADVTITNIIQGGQDATDDMPRLDGSKAVPAAAWTPVGNGTWTTVWPHTLGRPKGAIILHEVNGAGDSINGQLARKHLVATVVSTPRSYHVSSDPGTTPVTITVRPADGDNPSAGDVLYRASYYPEPVRIGARGRIFNIHTRRTGPENGLFIEGGGTVSGCSNDEPYVHGATILDGSGIIEDCFITRMIQPKDTNGQGAVPFVIALPTSGTQTATFRRCAYRGLGLGMDLARAFLTHPDPDVGGGVKGPVHGLYLVEDCAVLDTDGGVYGEATKIVVDGLYSENVRAVMAPTTAELVVRRLVSRNQGNDPLRSIKPAGVSTGTLVIEESHFRSGVARHVVPPSGVHLTVSRSVSDGRAALGSFGSTAGLTMHYTVVRTVGAAVTLNITGAYVGDYNLFVGPFRCTYNGVNHFSLAAWQAATGQDAHSVHIVSPTAVLDPNDTGDARVDPAAISGTDLAVTGVGQDAARVALAHLPGAWGRAARGAGASPAGVPHGVAGASASVE